MKGAPENFLLDETECEFCGRMPAHEIEVVWFDEDIGLVEKIMVCDQCDDDRLLKLLMAHRGPGSRGSDETSVAREAIDLDCNMAWVLA